MSKLLSRLQLSRKVSCDGLVAVNDAPPNTIPLSEQRIIRDTYKISPVIDYVFFRRFNNNEIISSQAIAYVVENESDKASEEELAELHHTLWLNGTIPLLYIDCQDRVDILSCMSEPVSNKASEWKYKPKESIFSVALDIDDQIKRFSADRLSDGTFWDDERNKIFIDIKKSSHSILIEKVKWADRKINGKNDPVARRLLLLTLHVKYLEDRGVFNYERTFFKKYHKDAKSFYDVLDIADVNQVMKMFNDLEKKFNGDIFTLIRKEDESITKETLQKVAKVVQANSDETGQLYFWDIYNFEHIPVEVLSHIYQYFADKENGAVFTPILLVNLMLDQVMPFAQIKGNEKIFDPTCGSGIFLVSAFRRLVYVNEMKNGGNRLIPQDLIQLLGKTIFGVELQEEAAHIACFSLALAVCDALRPDIIWNELRFEKLIGNNIFIGDFAERGKDALITIGPAGFDIILGNPPFKSALTDLIKSNISGNGWSIPPDNQMAYYVLTASIKQYLANSGKLCMIQPYGFLYNSQPAKMRSGFFADHAVVKILDFVSINGLFYGADTKAIALEVRKIEPDNKHIINHLTFRRTASVQERIYFELDYYDYHYVSQKDAIDEKFMWKANLLCGGLLNQLTLRLRENFHSIRDFIIENKWIVSEGYIIGNGENDGSFLKGMPLLTVKSFSDSGLVKRYFGKVEIDAIERPRQKIIYEPPLIVMHKKDALEMALWTDGSLAYNHSFIGIKAPESQINEFKSFFKNFINIKEKYLESILLLLGSQTLAGRSTAALSKDIMDLPWPKNGDFELVPWEKELLADIRDYMAEYVRIGQEAKILRNSPTKTDLKKYSNTFLRIMQNAYPNMKQIKFLESNNLILVAYSFSNKEDSLPVLNDPHWADELQSLMEKEQSYSLRTRRLAKIFTGNTVMIIKPNKMRFWIRSTAIRDVDDILAKILRG
jgi:type I restriction-modification system DNA methylase subunit